MTNKNYENRYFSIFDRQVRLNMAAVSVVHMPKSNNPTSSEKIDADFGPTRQQ